MLCGCLHIVLPVCIGFTCICMIYFSFACISTICFSFACAYIIYTGLTCNSLVCTNIVLDLNSYTNAHKSQIFHYLIINMIENFYISLIKIEYLT